MDSQAVDLDELKPVALKRKSIAHGDKVRYRVYKTSDDFVAVIAENALMAMKVSGVLNPYKIVRDLPLTGRSVDAGDLVPHHTQPTAFIKPHKVPDAPARFEPVAVDDKGGELEAFQPLVLASLHEGKRVQASTIDVATLLKALEGVVPVAEQPIAKEEPALAPAPPKESSLSADEVAKLLSEPRA